MLSPYLWSLKQVQITVSNNNPPSDAAKKPSICSTDKTSSQHVITRYNWHIHALHTEDAALAQRLIKMKHEIFLNRLLFENSYQMLYLSFRCVKFLIINKCSILFLHLTIITTAVTKCISLAVMYHTILT